MMPEENYIIKNISFETERIINLELVRKDLSLVFNYRPGQYAMLAYKRNGVMTSWHPFTIASSPSCRNSLKFGIKIFGNFTKGLSELTSGDTLYIKGPYGKFTFDENAYENRVFVAGGIGVTPFLSAIKYANDNGFKSKITLIYAVHSLSDIAFWKDIKKLEETNKNFKAYLVVKHKEGQFLMPERFHVGVVDKDVLYSIVNGDIMNSLFLLCGPAPFMKSVQGNLKKVGVPHKRIKFESFATNSVSIKANYKIFLPILSASAILLFFALNSISLASEKKFIAKKNQDNIPQALENQNGVDMINEDIVERESIFAVNEEIISRMTKLLEEKEARIIDLNKERLRLLEKSGATIGQINGNILQTESSKAVPPKTVTQIRKVVIPKPEPVVVKESQVVPPLAPKIAPPPAPVVKAPPIPPQVPIQASAPAPRTTVS